MSLMGRLQCNLHGGWWLVTMCFLQSLLGRLILEKIFVQDDTQFTHVGQLSREHAPFHCKIITGQTRATVIFYTVSKHILSQ
jgi:hypothetical protein